MKEINTYLGVKELQQAMSDIGFELSHKRDEDGDYHFTLNGKPFGTLTYNQDYVHTWKDGRPSRIRDKMATISTFRLTFNWKPTQDIFSILFNKRPDIVGKTDFRYEKKSRCH